MTAKTVFELEDGTVDITVDIPMVLYVLNETLNELAKRDLETRRNYPKDRFMEMFLKEEDDTTFDRGYDYLVDELVKIYNKEKGVEDLASYCEILNPKEDTDMRVKIII